MSTFTLNGNTFTQNDLGNRFYKTVDGKKTRISYKEFEEAFDAYWAEQGVTDPVEPVDEPKEEKKSTPKRTSKKAPAFVYDDGVTKTTLTEKQVDFIKHLPDTCFWENGLDSQVWVDVLCDEIGGQFAGKPMTVGAMVSTLCEKDIGFRAGSVIEDISTGRKRKATSFGLTSHGKVIASKLGL